MPSNSLKALSIPALLILKYNPLEAWDTLLLRVEIYILEGGG
jgi:hypothetical protein